MSPITRIAIPFLLLLAAVLPASCSWSKNDRLPGYLTLRLTSNPTTLDPALITDVMGGSIAAKLFNGLVRFDERLSIVPDVADSWSLSQDGRTYTFRLKKGVRFSNGREVTAGDFRYSFERVLDPKTKAPLTWVLDKIAGSGVFIAGTSPRVSGIRTPDKQTLVLTLEKPFGPFLSLLAMPTAYAVPAEEVKRLGPEFGTHPMGTGPFTLAEWKHGQNLMLSARENYFEGSPKIKGILYRVIPEDLTAVMEFETGGLDAILIPSSEYRRYRTDPVLSKRVIGKPGLSTYYLGLNCTRPPFNDRRVRRAVNRAINRKRILDTVFEQRGLLAAGPVPPELWKFGMGPKDRSGYAYEPMQAKEQVRQAGAAGTRITIYGSGESEVLDFLEVIKWYLDQAGFDTRIRQLDWSAFKNAVKQGEPDAFWLSWWADYPDPENFLYPLFHSSSVGPGGNKTRCLDPELDRLIETAQRTVDERKRYALYRAAEDRIIENAPWIFMWHRGDYYAVQPRVKDFRVYPIYSIDKGMDVELEEEKRS